MSKTCDYVVVGSGLTGAVIARELADAGRDVVVLERRQFVGGNVRDELHASGIRFHCYGPHYFRTTSDDLWEFVNRFASFYRFEAVLKTLVDGQLEAWPISQEYLLRSIGPTWHPDFQGMPANFEEASLSMMPRLVYDKFVRPYTEKQWGVPARSLSANLAKRFSVRMNGDERLMQHKYQGLPRDGYARFMQRMLEGITVLTGVDYLRDRDAVRHKRKLVFTGPIDEFYGFDLGRLVYRGQKRTHRFIEGADRLQPCVQVNNPAAENGPTIRTIEWKHVAESSQGSVRGTLLTDETPFTASAPDECEYPFPDENNRALYSRYRKRAEASEDILVAGRLGEYSYYDMDQAIGRARLHARHLLQERLT